MNIRNLSTTIMLSNDKDKKFINFKSFSNEESKKSNIVEIENVLENSIIKNFLNTNIMSIKYVRTFISQNNYRECVELKNSGNSSLVIISDNINEHFKDLMSYINENRTKIYEKCLFDIICKYDIDKIIFKLSNNNLNSGIDIIEQDNERKLIYNVPYIKNDKNKIIIDQKDLELIQNTVNNYFGITGSNIKGLYDDAVFNRMNKFVIYTNNADIMVEGNDIYKGLELYFGVFKRDYERIFLEQRDKDFKESQKNIIKSRLRVLKKEDNKE